MPNEQLEKLIEYLSGKKKVLFLTTSNRWDGSKEIPKSTLLAMDIQKKLEETTEVTLLEIHKLKIFPCEGNVSGVEGNNCGVKDAQLKDEEKDPSGNHRCWASINNKEDELWKVSKELFESEAVIFFVGKGIWTSDMGLGNALLATSLGNVGAFLARLCIFSWVF